MKIMMGKARAITVWIMLVLASVPAFAADQSPLAPSSGRCDLGLIFNTTDILLSLDKYGAGIGVKIGLGKTAYRAMMDIAFSGNTAPDSPFSLSIVAGLAFEYHFIQAAISPYVGAAASAGFIMLGDMATTIPISAGAILGIEVFPIDFLSAFVEYTLALDMNIVTDAVTQTTTTNFLVDARMGNSAKIGIVFYFMRMKKK